MARPTPIVIPGSVHRTESKPADLLGLLQGLNQIAQLYQSTIGASNRREEEQAGIAEVARYEGLDRATPGAATQSPTGGMVNEPPKPGLDIGAVSKSPSMGKAITKIFEDQRKPPEYRTINPGDFLYNIANPKDTTQVGTPKDTGADRRTTTAGQVQTDFNTHVGSVNSLTKSIASYKALRDPLTGEKVDPTVADQSIKDLQKQLEGEMNYLYTNHPINAKTRFGDRNKPEATTTAQPTTVSEAKSAGWSLVEKNGKKAYVDPTGVYVIPVR